jgi:hypothetical protein
MGVPRAGNSEETPLDEWVVEDFGTLNTKVPRPAVGDNEFFWNQNWMPLGVGRMRAVPAEATSSLYSTSGSPIIYVYPYSISSTSYWAVFFADGTAIQVNTNSGATTQISTAANLFYNAASPTLLPACAQFQNKYLAIVNTLQASNYWIWDGSILYGCATNLGTATASLSPDYTITNSGQGYTSAPTIAISGGTGTGASGTATVKNGALTGITITNPGSGYSLNDQPILTVSGGGSDSQAQATAVISSGSGGISSIYILNGGTGYTTSSTFTVSGGGGSGAVVVLTGLSNGTITSIAIQSPGTGYTSAPTITASVGSGASFSVQIAAGQITSVSVVNGGSGYYSAPTVSILGNGTGAVITAIVAGGVVTGFTVVNGGSGYSRAAVLMSGGNRSASATISLMPIGVSGTTVETYQNRVWIGNGINLVGSGPATVSNFATSAGGVLAQVTDSSLKRAITRLAQSSGYLYVFGDSSISVLSNINVSSTGVTTYNLTNVDPQVGTAWRDSVAPLGRALVFANPTGVYALYGGAAEKVSPQLDGLFLSANFSKPTPTASIAVIYEVKCYLLNFSTINPLTKASQTLMAAWDGQKWFTITQLKTPFLIQTQEIDSGITSWGTNGVNLFQMLQTPSTQLTKVFQTKLRKAPNYTTTKRALRFYFVGQNNGSDPNPAFTLQADTDAVTGQPVALQFLQTILTFTNASGNNLSFTGAGGATVQFFPTPPVSINGTQLSTYGRMIGYTLTTTGSDVDIISFTTQFSEFAPFG